MGEWKLWFHKLTAECSHVTHAIGYRVMTHRGQVFPNESPQPGKFIILHVS
jgi:hypothetical protein